MRAGRRWTLGSILAIAVAIAAVAVIARAQTSSSTATGPAPSGLAKATFAGGCFWCVEADFDKVPGVISTTSGYTGGKVANPSYEQVSAKVTGHAEAVEVVYDPKRVSYEQLVEYFWHTIDPTTKDASSATTDRRTAPRSSCKTRRNWRLPGHRWPSWRRASLSRSRSSPRLRSRGRSTRPRTTTRTTTRRIPSVTSTTVRHAGAMHACSSCGARYPTPQIR